MSKRTANTAPQAQEPQNNPAPQRPAAGPGRGGPMMGFGGGQKAKNFKGSMLKLAVRLKPYMLTFALTVIFTAAATVLSILAPGYIQKITDLIVPSMWGAPIDLGAIAQIALTLVIFYATSAVLNYIQAFIMTGVTQSVCKGLRTDISKKINVVPLSYYDKNSFGDVLSRVTNDVDTIGQTLNQSINSFIHSIIMVVGVLIAMFITSWQMALTALVTVPLSFALMMVIIKLSQKFFRRQARLVGELNGHVEEMYSGHAVVKAFCGEEKSQSKFDGINSKLFKSNRDSQFLSGLAMPGMTLLSNLGFIAVCVVGGSLFVAGIITPGVITAFFIYIRLFQNPLVQIAQAGANLQSTAAAAERVFEFLAQPEQEDESGKEAISCEIENVLGKVEFRNVRFGYDKEKPVIKDFSATVLPGQKVAIVGPTGAGKTTLINLIMRFYELDGGEILIDGVNARDMKRENVRAMFGMVLQDAWLFEGTIKENIIYSKANVTDEEVVAACQAANIDHFIRTLPEGYNFLINDDANISGGQRQLMTIARTMVQNSPMMILDEATSNVDTRTEQLIQNAMDEITKGRTSFVIAHRLSTIKNADIILVINGGDIVESGNHSDLLAKNGFYAQLYNSQFNDGEE